jgi:hypothetical protein
VDLAHAQRGRLQGPAEDVGTPFLPAARSREAVCDHPRVLEDFTIETFADRVGEHFRVLVDESALDAELIEATALASAAGEQSALPGDRTPFSIVFRGPQEPILPQRIYRFEHQALGAFEIFVVPIGRDGDGVRYEAVFT